MQIYLLQVNLKKNDFIEFCHIEILLNYLKKSKSYFHEFKKVKLKGENEVKTQFIESYCHDL